MTITDIIMTVVGYIVFLAWIVSMASWIKRGMPIPKRVHWLAGIASACCISAIIFLALRNSLSLKAGVLLFVSGPVVTYFAWLWMFGPDWEKDKLDKTTKK